MFLNVYAFSVLVLTNVAFLAYKLACGVVEVFFYSIGGLDRITSVVMTVCVALFYKLVVVIVGVTCCVFLNDAIVLAAGKGILIGFGIKGLLEAVIGYILYGFYLYV